MLLTNAIIAEATNWLGCKETSKNRSDCVDKVQELYNGKINRDAWCAKFVYAITDVACKKLGIDNPLFKTAGTTDMLNKTKTKIRTDSTPAKGSVFYTTRIGGGHVGFVIATNGNQFTTIEGNTNDSKGVDGVYSLTRSTADKNYKFMHLEDLDTIENNINNVLAPFNLEIRDTKLWIGIGIIGVLGYGLWRFRA